ncbi:MAG: archaetidylinositol phosphate synthase [archaeon GB-1867-035]|nr:archaetidylinositol phosphate synthase [Candidatus Culexmicrobium profundum]
MLNKLREKLKKYMDPLAVTMANLGVSPNLISILGLLFAFISGLMFLYRRLILAFCFILLSGFFDVLDGAVARASGSSSSFGAFFDSMLDRISDFLIISSILYASLCTLEWGILALAGSFLVSYARARGEALGVEMSGVGIAERAERLIILALGSLLNLIEWAIIAIAILTLLTVTIRFYKVWIELRET